MTDKSVLSEVVLLLERPREHRYRWLNRPAPPFSYLVKGGEARWTFHPADGGTRIHWLYTFDLTPRSLTRDGAGHDFLPTVDAARAGRHSYRARRLGP